MNKDLSIDVEAVISGTNAINLKTDSAATITETYEANGMSETPTWAVYTKGTTAKPNWCSINTAGELSVTTADVPAGEVSEITITATTASTNEEKTFDVRVVPTGMNVVGDTENNTTTLADDLTQSQINLLCKNSEDTGEITISLPGGTTTTVVKSTIKEVKLNSVNPEVTSIGDYFLYKISNMTKCECDGFANVTTIGKYFLTYAYALEEIDYAPLANVTKIGQAFTGVCRALKQIKNIDALKNVKEFGPYCFDCLVSLEGDIDISSWTNVVSIDHSFFTGCSKITSFTANFASYTKICYGFLSAGHDRYDRYSGSDNLTRLNLGDLTAENLTVDKGNDAWQVSFSTNTTDVPGYNPGITLIGTNKDAIKAKFPNKTNKYYRHWAD